MRKFWKNKYLQQKYSLILISVYDTSDKFIINLMHFRHSFKVFYGMLIVKSIVSF
jgi:hypothetical protein